MTPINCELVGVFLFNLEEVGRYEDYTKEGNYGITDRRKGKLTPLGSGSSLVLNGLRCRCHFGLCL